MSEVTVTVSNIKPEMNRSVRFFIGRQLADIRSVDDDEVAKGLDYQPCELTHGSRDHHWECLMATDEDNKNIKYFKPVRPYTEYEFEHFFGFGRKCSGFTSSRIVRYTPRVWVATTADTIVKVE